MTPADLDRFRRLAGLLGSEHVGERAAAALKCSELLKVHGLTWADVTLPVKQPDVLAMRRDAMDSTMKEHAWRAQRDAEQAMSDEAIRNANDAKKAAAAQRRAAWEAQRYGADADGFEPGRK